MRGERGPIFVVGVPRSGTTLVRYMLSSHPHLYLPPESAFLPRFAGVDPHGPLDRERAIELARHILADDWFFRDWLGRLPSPEELVDQLAAPTPATLLDELYSRYAAQFGASRWGDKTPAHTEHLDLITRLFPTAQVVHVIRDGRDVALSMLAMKRGGSSRFFYVDVYYAARTWRQRVRRTRAAGRRHGAERYHEVRYEELTADPEPVLRALCDFLGEAYDPAMLEHHTVARQHASSKGRHAATREPVTTRSAGRWRREMASADRRLFEAVAGDVLVELGYGQGGERLAPTERARLAALATKYVIADGGRRSLQRFGVLHPTSILPRSVLPANVSLRRTGR